MQKVNHKYFMPEDGEPQKKPPGKTKPKVSKKKPAKIAEAEYDPLTPEIGDLIANAMARFYAAAETSQNLRQSKLKDLEHLDGIVQEFLSSYLILGYDINGEKVTITHARNPQDKDALVEHLRSTFINTVNG